MTPIYSRKILYTNEKLNVAFCQSEMYSTETLHPVVSHESDDSFQNRQAAVLKYMP